MKKDAEDKKVRLQPYPCGMVLIKLPVPKKSKIKVRAPARALDMDEGNIVEHKNYLFVKEEKRKRAHAVRATISGPLLRWISRHETITVPAETQCLPGMLEFIGIFRYLH
jgi:hypothetical protein